jgi:hypothetical protein
VAWHSTRAHQISGDRVQWFRAEAEMERWREEWEIKQADFLRCIRSFNKMSCVWDEMARNSTKVGKCAYAKHKSALFKEMEQHARKLFNDAGYGHLIKSLLDNDEGKILADYVILERSHPQYIIPELTVKVKTKFSPLLDSIFNVTLISSKVV